MNRDIFNIICSQSIVIPAFIIAYITLYMCKAVDHPEVNLAGVVPWYAYILIYFTISYIAFFIVPIDLRNKK